MIQRIRRAEDGAKFIRSRIEKFQLAEFPAQVVRVLRIAEQKFFKLWRREDAGASGYEVNVYAYPDVTVARFLARHLPFVETYFRRKTREIVGLVSEIVKANVAEHQARAAAQALAAAGDSGKAMPK